MKAKSYLLLVVLIFISYTGCERLGNKLQEKINEKVDQKIDENLKKVDSVLKDVGTQLDTMQEKSLRSLDSIKYQLDSANSQIKEMIEKQKEKLDLKK